MVASNAVEAIVILLAFPFLVGLEVAVLYELAYSQSIVTALSLRLARF